MSNTTPNPNPSANTTDNIHMYSAGVGYTPRGKRQKQRKPSRFGTLRIRRKRNFDIDDYETSNTPSPKKSQSLGITSSRPRTNSESVEFERLTSLMSRLGGSEFDDQKASAPILPESRVNELLDALNAIPDSTESVSKPDGSNTAPTTPEQSPAPKTIKNAPHSSSTLQVKQFSGLRHVSFEEDRSPVSNIQTVQKVATNGGRWMKLVHSEEEDEEHNVPPRLFSMSTNIPLVHPSHSAGPFRASDIICFGGNSSLTSFKNQFSISDVYRFTIDGSSPSERSYKWSKIDWIVPGKHNDERSGTDVIYLPENKTLWMYGGKKANSFFEVKMSKISLDTPIGYSIRQQRKWKSLKLPQLTAPDTSSLNTPAIPKDISDSKSTTPSLSVTSAKDPKKNSLVADGSSPSRNDKTLTSTPSNSSKSSKKPKNLNNVPIPKSQIHFFRKNNQSHGFYAYCEDWMKVEKIKKKKKIKQRNTPGVIYQFSTKDYTWTKLEPVNPEMAPPTSLDTTSVCMWKNILLVFGSHQPLSNTVQGPSITPRNIAKTASLQDENSECPFHTLSMWSFDFDSKIWSKWRISNAAPITKPGSNVSAHILENRLVIFATSPIVGQDLDGSITWCTRIYTLDLIGSNLGVRMWRPVQTRGTPPISIESPKVHMLLADTSGVEFCLFGGVRKGKPNSETFILKLTGPGINLSTARYQIPGLVRDMTVFQAFHQLGFELKKQGIFFFVPWAKVRLPKLADKMPKNLDSAESAIQTKFFEEAFQVADFESSHPEIKHLVWTALRGYVYDDTLPELQKSRAETLLVLWYISTKYSITRLTQHCFNLLTQIFSKEGMNLPFNNTVKNILTFLRDVKNNIVFRPLSSIICWSLLPFKDLGNLDNIDQRIDFILDFGPSWLHRASSKAAHRKGNLKELALVTVQPSNYFSDILAFLDVVKSYDSCVRSIDIVDKNSTLDSTGTQFVESMMVSRDCDNSTSTTTSSSKSNHLTSSKSRPLSRTSFSGAAAALLPAWIQIVKPSQKHESTLEKDGTLSRQTSALSIRMPSFLSNKTEPVILHNPIGMPLDLTPIRCPNLFPPTADLVPTSIPSTGALQALRNFFVTGVIGDLQPCGSLTSNDVLDILEFLPSIYPKSIIHKECLEKQCYHILFTQLSTQSVCGLLTASHSRHLDKCVKILSEFAAKNLDKLTKNKVANLPKSLGYRILMMYVESKKIFAPEPKPDLTLHLNPTFSPIDSSSLGGNGSNVPETPKRTGIVMKQFSGPQSPFKTSLNNSPLSRKSLSSNVSEKSEISVPSASSILTDEF